MRLAAGVRLGSFTIVGPLGAGGMGEVYLAHDSRLERDVALKVLPSRVTDDAETRARFRQEALVLASLNHPNLATVHGFEEDDAGALVMVLERVEGVSLSQRLEQGALPVDEALQVGLQVSHALEAAHERGVIHRDVKPGNIMIGPRGLVKVLDFGLARRVAGPEARVSGVRAPAAIPDADLAESETIGLPAPVAAAPEDGETLSGAGSTGTSSMTGMLVGTPGYMSPEQAMAAPVDARTDVFALGCVLYECLSGRRAFAGATPLLAIRATLEREADLAALPAGLPAPVRELLTRCLAKPADSRPASAAEVRLALEAALGRIAPAAGAARHNLPAAATSFVGREAVLEACGRALDATRLLTLIGIGGAGKTRLAVRLAEARLGAFAGGVWFVDVAPLVDPERLVEVLAAALGVQEEPGLTLGQAVVRALESRRALIVLDNAETQTGACAALASALLGSCRELTLLVTSRVPLGVDGENCFPVPVLDVPGPSVATAAEASGFESVLLFAERARAASPAFELTDGNAAAVAEICRRLDGIPLALELAAARTRLLGVEQIRARLDDRFKLLTRSGTQTGRQQTVHAVLQWSWDHLLPPEQALLAHLAAFTGGWTLEHAVAVHAPGGDEFEVLDLLTRLVERSLVVVDNGPHGAVRYRFLESVWRFAQEKLGASAESDAVRDRHAQVYLAFAEAGERVLIGPDVARMLGEMSPEEENFLGALEWSLRAPGGTVNAMRLAAACHRMWMLLGHFEVGSRAVSRVLSADTELRPSPERAKLLARAAGHEMTTGDVETAEPHLRESLEICHALGDRLGEARALSGLAVVAMWRGRVEDHLELSGRGLAIYESLGSERGVAMALHNIGTAEQILGRPALGREKFERALVMLRRLGDVTTEGLSLGALTVSLVHIGDLEAATRCMRECLDCLATVESPRESVYACDALAELLQALGRPHECARMLGAAERVREEFSLRLMPHERTDLARLRLALERELGAARCDAERTVGHGWTVTTALAQARELLGGA